MVQKMPTKLRLKLANECEDLLARVKMNPLNKNFRYYLLHSKQIDQVTLAKMMTLFESLMKSMYEKSSWGWDEEEKLSEWKHQRTRVILVTESDNCEFSKGISTGMLPEQDDEIIAFLCFRFEVGADKAECALYTYELQIHPEFQRQGLGNELMQIARLLAKEFKMDKMMLTVFRSNLQAIKFYQKLKFIKDKSSPAENESDYVIMSSKI